MQYLEFIFSSITIEQKDILIALLSEAGFNGFEESDAELKACISSIEFDEASFNNIIELTQTIFSRSIIQEINWNEKWEADFEPVIVLHPVTKEPFAKVRASFHKQDNNVLHEIIVTPKMSFGTGHHATTYLMIERMGLQSFADKTVIDFGTGTAVLAILAEKIGAKNIIAIDNDDWSINNAKENIEANNCTRIKLQKAETIHTDVKADIILANINLNVIIANLDEMINACNDTASILFSGILVQDKEHILKALNKKNIEVLNCFEKNNWIVLETKCTK